MHCQRTLAVLLSLAPLFLRIAPARADDLILRIPPVRTSVNVQNQPISITASGTLALLAPSGGQQAFALKVNADLSDLQRNITALLQPQLSKNEPCGERMSLERAVLNPMEPASLLTAYVHYERWACMKALGKHMVKRLVGGNGMIQVKLTPAVENGREVRLIPEVQEIQADGSLGELLRSGSFGATLREKISKTIVSAMEKGTNFRAVLPPAMSDLATLRSVRFANEGAGRLGLELSGEVHVSRDQIEYFVRQLKSQ